MGAEKAAGRLNRWVREGSDNKDGCGTIAMGEPNCEEGGCVSGKTAGCSSSLSAHNALHVQYYVHYCTTS